MEPDNEYQPHPKQNPSNRYSENEPPNNDEEEKNQDVNNFKLIQNEENALNKRSRTASNDEGDFLFENHQGQADKGDKSAYNTDAADPNEDSRNIKHHCNTKQAECRGLRDEKRYKDQGFYSDRGRRHVQKANEEDTLNLSSTLAENESLENTATEDEEAAIKRHVKRLSGQELQELLSSLSEDKRELLKKIMENDSESSDKISKREITKKAGTAEENNNLIDNALADSSKLQEGSSPLDINTDAPQNSPASGIGTKQPEPQTDINDLGVMKTFSSNISAISPANTENSNAHGSETSQLKSDSSLNSNINPEDSKNQPNLDSNGQSHKIENKREINSNDNSNLDMSFEDSKIIDNEFNLKDSQESSNDLRYYCPQDEDSSQIIDDEAQLHSIDGNSMKRDAYADREADFSNSIKSLEESFPNSIPYDESDPYSGSDMAPLVRVKRKNNLMIKKRAAAVMPDAKVAYFPYRAENDDEDNDEGNEFDDDGFYDRTSNLENRNVNDKPVEEESPNYDSPNRRLKTSNRNWPMNVKRAKVSQSENMEIDTVNLGSDTDSVLSGAEGVDENLMYNGGSRNRRAPGLNPGDQAGERQQRSTPLAEDEGTPTAEQNHAPNYQENDAFGPLPRNYEGDLGRYKRIRRVKQQGASQEDATS